jgi:hypothetical protein
MQWLILNINAESLKDGAAPGTAHKADESASHAPQSAPL